VKPLLVGEAPSRATDGGPPFSGRSGTYVAWLAQIPSGRVEDAFEPVNLLPRWPGPAGKASAFPLDEARFRGLLLLAAQPEGRTVVVAGRRAWAALGLPASTSYLSTVERDGLRLALIPHPSGVNRFWNDLAAEKQAIRFLRGLLSGAA
jgi:uracil-DNA glycosylase